MLNGMSKIRTLLASMCSSPSLGRPRGLQRASKTEDEHRPDDTKVVKELLATRSDPSQPDFYGWTALHLAAHFSTREIILELLDSAPRPEELRDRKDAKAVRLCTAPSSTSTGGKRQMHCARGAQSWTTKKRSP